MGEDEPTSTTYVLDVNIQPISLSSLDDSHVDLSSLSPFSPHSRSFSTPVVYHYNTLSLKKAPPETHSYFANINKKFLDSATGVTYQIAGISEMSATGFENEFVYQFYDTSLYSSCPLDPDSTEFEPCSQFLSDLSYKFIDTPTRISRKTRRVNMVKTNKNYRFDVNSPVSVEQALRHEHADYFMQSLDDEMERLLKKWALMMLSLAILTQ
jgi:hypothetical protein